VLREHEQALEYVAFSADASSIIAGSRGHPIRVWDVASGNRRNIMEVGHGCDVHAIAAGAAPHPRKRSPMLTRQSFSLFQEKSWPTSHCVLNP